jgi:hypothetical protein
MTHRRTTRLVTVVLLGCSALVSGAEPAAAHPPKSCATGIYVVDGTTHASDTNARGGIKTDMHIGDGEQCSRVSTIAVEHGSTGVVEWGWTLGWSYKADNVYTGPGACDDNYYGTDPIVFLVWVPDGGAYHCREVVIVSPNQTSMFAIHDGNGDTIWTGDYKDEGGIVTANLNFHGGGLVTNGEVHKLTDEGHAEFSNLQYEDNDGSGTYHDFPNSYNFSDSNPNFHWVRDSDKHTEVDHD